MDSIVSFFSQNFSNCVWLAVILVAMCPTLESKISIPLAMNASIWGSESLTAINAFLLSFIGSIIPCYFIILFIRKLKKKTTGFVTNKLLQKYKLKSQNIQNRAGELKKYMALTAFVSVPLPLTGVWTGSLIAGLTNLNIHYSFLAISVGTFISSFSITLLCSVFKNSIMYILIISLIILIIFLLGDLLFSIFNLKRKSKK